MHARQNTIDNAAFGVIYGTITVLSLLMALHQPIDAPFRTTLVLFGAVFAVALAKAYAEVCERMLADGRPAQAPDFAKAWQHSQTVLLAANAPAACIFLAAVGLWSVDTGFLLAQIAAILSLVYFGGRIGWRTGKSILSALAGASITAAIGVLISSLKYLAH